MSFVKCILWNLEAVGLSAW